MSGHNKNLIVEYVETIYKKMEEVQTQTTNKDLEQQKKELQQQEQLANRKMKAVQQAEQEIKKRKKEADALSDSANKYRHYCLEALKLLEIQVNRGITKDNVYEVSRKKALKFHPDKNATPEGEVQFNTLKHATGYVIAYLNYSELEKKADSALTLLKNENKKNPEIKLPKSSLNIESSLHVCHNMIDQLEDQAEKKLNASPEFLENNKKLKTAYQDVFTFLEGMKILNAGW